MAQYLLPDEARNALAGANLSSQESNLSLLSNLYLKAWTETAGNWEITTASKEELFKVMRSVDQNPFLERVRNRTEAALDDFKQKKIFSLKTNWRMVVGLGTPSPLETSMTLHPIYGFPYIPATAVKGVARAWAENHTKYQKEAKQKLLLEIFGSEDKYSNDSKKQQMGGIIFFDALPKGFPKLELDVMTPHYSEYYTKGEIPGDWYSPVPIKFLTVGTESEFTFSLALSGRSDASHSDELLSHAETFLKEGLINLGIGAKTNAGYGYFADDTGGTVGQGVAVVAEPEVFPGKLKQGVKVAAQVIKSESGTITVKMRSEEANEVTFRYAAGMQLNKWIWVEITNLKPLNVKFVGVL